MERRRIVADATRTGIFRVESTEDAEQIAQDIRIIKSIDPALGLYAAYAYAASGKLKSIRSVRRYMRYDLGGSLYDVALLAGDRPDPTRQDIAPLVDAEPGLAAPARQAGRDPCGRRGRLRAPARLAVDHLRGARNEHPARGHRERTNTMKILLVHGRGQAGKNSAEIKRRMVHRPRARLRGRRRRHAVDDRAGDVPVAASSSRWYDSTPRSAPIATRGPGNVDRAYLKEFHADVAEEVRQAAGMGDEGGPRPAPARRPRRARPAELGVGPGNPPRNRQPVPAVQRLPARAGHPATCDLPDGLRCARPESTNSVRDALDSEPTVVVGHSLGSVITYSVLRQSTSHNVPRYVTLGSPLGLKTIRQRFRPLAFPPCAADWFNAE